MSCTVAISSSPAFSPSRIPLSLKTSPEATATLFLSSYHISDASPPPPRSAAAASSPFRSRFYGLRASRNDAASPIAATGSIDDPSPSPKKLASGGAPLLKRKRPARIDIPLAETLAFSPAASGGGSEVEVESEGYSVFCKRGKRRAEMEDRHRVDADLLGDSQMALFGIFDGHSGARAAEYASENLGARIAQELKGDSGCGLEEATRIGYLKTDAEFLKGGEIGGTCCVTAIVRKGKGDLVVSNAGDCRAVLSRGGVAEALTSDHRPSREDEKERIERLGGYVDYCRGVWRLQGSLAVSRGIGDRHMKQWVSAEPETTTIRIEPECEFLILASDGLWDKVSNQEAVDVARPLCTDMEKPSPLSACRRLVNLSASRGSVDDISVMIVQLGHFV